VPSFTKVAVLLISSLLIFSRISAIAFSNEEWAALVEKAEKGDAETQWTVGCVYYDGLHRPKNDKQAAQWFLEAAMRGHTEAQIALGSCYELGEGVPKDTLTAYALYSVAGIKAAENKNLLAKKMTPKQIADGKERTKALQKEIASFKKRPQDFKR
jgi:TPR repeat protein